MIAFGSLESAFAFFFLNKNSFLALFNVRLLACNLSFSLDSLLAYDNLIKFALDSPTLSSGCQAAVVVIWPVKRFEAA